MPSLINSIATFVRLERKFTNELEFLSGILSRISIWVMFESQSFVGLDDDLCSSGHIDLQNCIIVLSNYDRRHATNLLLLGNVCLIRNWIIREDPSLD
jgi:hypothetical protein